MISNCIGCPTILNTFINYNFRINWFIRKIESFLGISLTTDYEPVKIEKKRSGKALTLGDVVDLD